MLVLVMVMVMERDNGGGDGVAVVFSFLQYWATRIEECTHFHIYPYINYTVKNTGIPSIDNPIDCMHLEDFLEYIQTFLHYTL